MPILKFPDGRKQYAIYKISTASVIDRYKHYPRAVDDEPIEGLDPDIVYLAMNQDIQPEYDSRIVRLLPAVETRDGAELHTTWEFEKRPVTDIQLEIQNKEAAELAAQFATAEQLKLTVLMVGVLRRKLEGLSLTKEEEAVVARWDELAAKAWQNDANAAALKAAAAAGQDVDPDSGWAEKATGAVAVTP